MEDIKELQNKLELLEPARDKVWNEYLDKSSKIFHLKLLGNGIAINLL